ncbi:MAG: enoyl-CoA hydratase-related protein, partial [Thermoanaerobaculia bacterium]|nr:enoyl-CoA hydratase-related protein [Thermoanaerobaculia bacterium]
MPVVLTDLAEGILTVTVNRPEKLNALNAEVIEELRRVFHEAKSNAEVGALVLTGAGEKAFVAGADISGFPSLTPVDARDFARKGQAVLDLLETMGKPSVAAVNGFALGGGCELAMACSMRVAASNARFGQPEVALGLIPGYAGTQRLPRLVGKGRALELILTGDPIPAE